MVNPDIKIHTVVTGELDYDHEAAMCIPLGEVTDEQLLAEVARRHLDLHSKITDTLVKETYEVGKLLGHGASGEVVQVTHKVSRQPFACKVVKKNANMNDAQSMSTEIEIMKRIRHRHVVSMYELYETPKCLWIILELVDGGDMYHNLAHSEGYNEVQAAHMMKQILRGIHYLHSLGVVHRDLKLDNLLLSGSGPSADVKIADFGLSALVRLDEEGYDAGESSKRKHFRNLKEVSFSYIYLFYPLLEYERPRSILYFPPSPQFRLPFFVVLSNHSIALYCTTLLHCRCGAPRSTSHRR